MAAVLQAIFSWFQAWDLSWSQELCIIMFVWMAKFGAAYGLRTGVHVGVDVAINSLQPGSRHRVVMFGLMAGALFTGIIAAFGTRFVLHMLIPDKCPTISKRPMWLVYLAIPIGSGLMSFRFIQVAWNFSRTGELPHTDESHVEGAGQGRPAAAG